MLVIFGVADLPGGIWTWLALRADARQDQWDLPGRTAGRIRRSIGLTQ